MLFRQNTRKARNNAIKMSQAFSTTSHCSNVSQIKTCLNIHSVSFKTGKGCFTILFDSAYFQFAVQIEGDESSLLRMANYPAGFVWLLALIDSPERVNMLLRCP